MSKGGVPFPLSSSVGKESTCNAGDPGLISGSISGEGIDYPLHYSLGFPGGSAGKDSTCNTADLASTPGFGRCPPEGKGCPLQYSGLENSMDCMVHGVTKSQAGLSGVHFNFLPFSQTKESR